MKTFTRLILFISTIAFLAGCSGGRKNWWVGMWRFNEEVTKQFMAQSGNDSVLAASTSLNFIYSLHLNSQTTITENEIIHVQNGNGSAKNYTVVEQPSAHDVILRMGDSVSTFTLDGNHMTTTITDVHGKQMKLFFEKAN